MKRLKVKIKPEIIAHCKKQLEEHNFGQRDKDNGNKGQQLVGIVGECVVREMFDLPYIDGKSGYDGGYDLKYKGKRYDVKTMTRSVDVKDSYTNNILKSQMEYDVDGYIFCSINKDKKELTVCGWIRKENAIKHRKLNPKGTIMKQGKGKGKPLDADWYEIDNKYLNFVNSIIDMKMQMISRWEKDNQFY